jgi:hypothetical protein
VRPKSKKANKRFGGLSVFVKSYLKGGIQFLKHQTNDYIRLQLCKEYFGLKQDIFICYMYNHPADSPYSRALDLDYFDVVEKEITDFSRQGQIIFRGDLNARTGSLPDFITEDNDDHLPLFNDYHPDRKRSHRRSKDNILISRGRQLNELCIQMGLRILNGRFFGDSLGQFTSYQYNGSSVIYYFIVSESLLDNISFFKVHKFNGLMSDHCKISMMLNINCFIHVSNPKLHIFPDRYKWGIESDTNFTTVLESNNTKKSITEFEKLISDTKSPTENDIENLV